MTCLHIEGDEDVQTVIDGLDALMSCHEVPRAAKRSAYDLMIRVQARMGSDGRYRAHPPHICPPGVTP